MPGSLSGGAAQAGGAAVVYPPDRALIEGSGAIDVLGFLPQDAPGSLTVRGKDGVQRYTAVAGAFTVAVKLAPGENAIEFGGRTVRVFLASAQAKATPDYSAADPHASDNGCEDCHALTAAAAALVDKPPALCANCHDDVLKNKEGKSHPVLHPPAEEGDCLACHPFHGLSIKRLGPAAKRALCFGCHDDFTADGKKKMHAPVAKGECTGCHGAHGAAEKKLLPGTGLKLCVLCHADPSHGKNGEDWENAHPALDDGCPSCHLPHVADAAGMLKKPQPEICADCHDPFPSEEGGKELVRHNPVEEGECAGCHAVHGTNEKKLLLAAGKALCVKCHTDPSLAPDGKEWSTPHPALDDGCPSCHLPHTAPQPALLKKAVAPLCFGCHDPLATPAEAAGASLHAPVAKGQCARCHAPHGSGVGKLLVAAPGKELCLKCHKNPAQTADGADWSVPHPALDDGCPTCHLPHLSQAPRLLGKPQRELCAGCHEDKNLNSDGEEWAHPHVPVRSGLCASCHGPHGSGQKALLVKSIFDLCTANCHTEMHVRHLGAEIDPATGQPAGGMVVLPPGFPVRKDGAFACSGCHQPHGSNNMRLWTKSEEMFCVQCHKEY